MSFKRVSRWVGGWMCAMHTVHAGMAKALAEKVRVDADCHGFLILEVVLVVEVTLVSVLIKDKWWQVGNDAVTNNVSVKV